MFRASSLMAFVGVMLAAQIASAQASFELQLFRPSPHGDALVTVESGAIVPSMDVRASLWLNYAYRPLEVIGFNGQRVRGIVDNRLDMQLSAAIALWDRVSFALTVPSTLYQGGSLEGFGSTNTLPAVTFGDIRLLPKIGLLDAKRFFVDLAVTLSLTLPTGYSAGFSGDRTVTFGGELDLSRHIGPVQVGGNFGYLWRERTQIADLYVDQEYYYRAGVGVNLAWWMKSLPVEIIGEIFGRTSAVTPFRYEARNPMEWTGAVRYTPLKWLQATLGAGRGILPGYGAPGARVYLGLVFIPISKEEQAQVAAAPVPVIGDKDGDGLRDDVDKCPDQPEDMDGFEDKDGCPDLDNDKDNIPDKDDKCPMVAEDRDFFEDTDGCPEDDNDKDGIPDIKDSCPNMPEDKDGFLDDDGCPEVDNDSDGIPDDKDKCPNEPETVNEVDDFDGCPDKGKVLVVVTKETISILEKVQFEVNSDKILPKSFGLLNQVVNTLRNHEQIKKLRIEGHTDSDGDDAYNMKLSQRRADSVRNYLVKAGLEPTRLLAVGYGETKPMAPNTSKRGKEQNRRVAFTILEGPGVDSGSTTPEKVLEVEPIKKPVEPKSGTPKK